MALVEGGWTQSLRVRRRPPSQRRRSRRDRASSPAAGGLAEKTFGALVGLELRPRRLRDAVNLFAALEAAGGATLRDRAWSHPDVAPGAADLDDPLGYVERLSVPEADDFDAELGSLPAREGGSEQDHE